MSKNAHVQLKIVQLKQVANRKHPSNRCPKWVKKREAEAYIPRSLRSIWLRERGLCDAPSYEITWIELSSPALACTWKHYTDTKAKGTSNASARAAHVEYINAERLDAWHNIHVSFDNR